MVLTCACSTSRLPLAVFSALAQVLPGLPRAAGCGMGLHSSETGFVTDRGRAGRLESHLCREAWGGFHSESQLYFV